MFRQENRKTRQMLASGHITYEDDPYPTSINFYKDPPTLNITIVEFEQFALDRMQVLTRLMNGQLRNQPQPKLEASMNEAISKHMPLSGNSSVRGVTREQTQERQKDYISHYIVRLAYCRSEELRNWFLRAECALFRYRFERLSRKEQVEFLKSQHLSWKMVSDDDKRVLQEKLKASSSFKNVNVEDEMYFEVDFERVPFLVGTRQVYVQGGKAYVPLAHQVILVLDEFKDRLSRDLEAMGRALPAMEEDRRLMPILNHLDKQYLGRDFTSSAIAGEIQAQDVDSLKVHMPLCMETLHNELRQEKHTRHGGRMQYGLFLKGMGLSLEQALIFWQTAFGKVTPDQFNKEYAYNVRHLYGMEGKRTDYTPYSCKSIIMGNAPGPQDHHGCPFRHFNETNLRAQMTSHMVDEFDTEDIMRLVKGRHYQVACTRYYEVTRARMLGIGTETLKGGGLSGNGGSEGMIASQELIEHPNQFFEQSFLLMKNNTATANGTNGDPSEVQAAPDPTIKGRYTYKKAGPGSSHTSNNMDMDME